MNNWNIILDKFKHDILDKPEIVNPLEEEFEELYEQVILEELSEEYEMGYSKLCFLLSAYMTIKEAQEMEIINYEKMKKRWIYTNLLMN